MTATAPIISVIIPTFNRATFLCACLDSLANQNIAQEQYEVIVVDDGSTDATADTCKGFLSRMNLRYVQIENSGISVAKNVGVHRSNGPILLFFDDDDVAGEWLLEEHLKTHEENPEENVAVLGYTTWGPTIQVTPVMEWVVDIGRTLFAYVGLRDGQVLDFDYFWGGRSSCKRSFLLKHGLFNEEFRFIVEDIDLGYRLSEFGLKVVFNRNAVSYMVRPVTYNLFCQRCERVGQSLFLFSRLHPDPAVMQYCQGQIMNPLEKRDLDISNAKEEWEAVKEILSEKVCRVHELESLLTTRLHAGNRNVLLEELRELYWWTFNAFKIKGFADAMPSDANGLAEGVRTISELHAQLEALGAQVAEKEQALQTVQAQVAEIQAQAAVNEQALQAQVADRDAQLEQITSSLGWRLLSHWGRIKYRYLLPVYRLLRLMPPEPETGKTEGVSKS